MNDPRWSVQDAKNRFSEVVEAAREKPQTVTKHGKRAVVVVAAEEYDRLKTLEKQKAISFREHLLNIPRDGGAFERMKIKFRDPGF
jgi:prevent-host-death family protein